MRFSSFFSGGFITAIVVNPPERRLAKRTSVQWCTVEGRIGKVSSSENSVQENSLYHQNQVLDNYELGDRKSKFDWLDFINK